MTREEAVIVAQEAATARGWTWRDPIRVWRRRKWLLFGPVRWEMWSNAEMRGCNVAIVIDDETGEVVSARFAPR